MYFVYILESKNDGGWYIGYTHDLRQRLQDHNNGNSRSTRFRRPFRLIYYECYLDRRDAMGREQFLKSGAGRIYIKKQLHNFLNKKTAT
jgi:putative endonuclease